MILFLGCSLTWGQSLVYDKWLSDGKSYTFLNEHTPPSWNQEENTFEDDEYRRIHSYPYLVSKELNRPYVTRYGNGGSNEENMFILKNFEKFVGDSCCLELVVFQFTEFMRDEKIEMINEKNYPILKSLLLSQLVELDHYCKNKFGFNVDRKSREVPWIAFSWRQEMSDLLKQHYPDNFMQLVKPNGDTYESISELVDNNVGLRYNEVDNKIKDAHPTHEYHKIVTESILNHIKNKKIKFSEYRNVEGGKTLV